MTRSRVVAATFAYNEGTKIRDTVDRLRSARNGLYDILVVDDGSTDGSTDALASPEVGILRIERNEGIGAAMKKALAQAVAQGYEVIVIMAGNNKDEPKEIPRLVGPILDDGFDFVQGSRFLAGGGYGNMPFYRRLATRVHPFLFSLATRRWLTESTNGFRAIRLSILGDARINWRQSWLDKYELEPYLLFKAITLGYRHKEVPVTKIYPPKKLGYTKMKPLIGWWSILRPIFLLGLHIRK